MTLTATVANTNASRQIPVTVVAAPEGLDTDYSAGYLWTHFAAEGGYVRDPHLVRSPDGDKYWIIGTDLHAEGGGPGGSGWDQLNASQNLVVWESTDLVNWSDQRIVFAGFEHAGNVWAPEAIYNDETGEYYVYWSARDRRENNTPDWALRVYLTKTRDFVTFTEPEVWASLNEQGDGQTGPNIIDSSIAKEGDTYSGTAVDALASAAVPLFPMRAEPQAPAASSFARTRAASVARPKTPARSASCNTATARSVVPFGLVTRRRSSAGSSPVASRRAAAPMKVCSAMSRASASPKPFATAAFVSSSTSRKT